MKGPEGTVDSASSARESRKALGSAVSAALVYLACTAAMVGVWAQTAPSSFYDDFPGVRRFWISLDGPYNEHLIRDIGGLNLSLALLTVAAVGLRHPGLAQLTAGCWLVYGLPHLAYHLMHLDPYEPLDAVAQAVAIATQVLLPLWILWVVSGSRTARTRGRVRSAGSGTGERRSRC